MLLLALNNSPLPGCQPGVHPRNLFPISLMYLLLLCLPHYIFQTAFPLYLMIVLRCLLRELNKGLETRNAHLYGPIPNLMMDMLLCIFPRVMMMIVIFTALIRNLVPVEASFRGNHATTILNLLLMKPDNK